MKKPPLLSGNTRLAAVGLCACLALLAGCHTAAEPNLPTAANATSVPAAAQERSVAGSPIADHAVGSETAVKPSPDESGFVVDASTSEPDAADAVAPAAGHTNWPVFRGNSQSTGVAASRLPEQLDVLWRYRVEKGAFEGTPAIVDGTVYLGDLDGRVYALDLANGQLRWKFTAEKTGFVASPSVHDSRVYMGDYYGTFFCLDAATGEKLWTFEAEAEIDSCANFYQGGVLFGSQDASLYYLDARTGKLRWKVTVEDQIRCTPTVAGNRTFLAGCDGQLHVVDLDEGQEVAAIDIEGPTGNTPAVVGDMAFFGTEGGTFFGVNWKQSRIVWRYTDERSTSYRSSAAGTERLIIVGGHGKRLSAFDTVEGGVVWEFAAKSTIDSSPVVVGQRVFIATTGGRLVAVSLAGGQELWQYEAGGGFVGSPAVADRRLVIANDEGVVYCFGSQD